MSGFLPRVRLCLGKIFSTCQSNEKRGKQLPYAMAREWVFFSVWISSAEVVLLKNEYICMDKP